MRGPAVHPGVVRPAQLPDRRVVRWQPGHRRPGRRGYAEQRAPVAPVAPVGAVRDPVLHRRLHPEVVGDEQPLRPRGVAPQRGPPHPGAPGRPQQDPVQPGRPPRQRTHRGQRIDPGVEGRGVVQRPVRLVPGVPQAQRGGRALGPRPAVVEVAEQRDLGLDAAQPLGEPGQFGLPPGGAVRGVVAGQVGRGDDQRPARRVHRDGGDRLVRAQHVQARLPHRQPASGPPARCRPRPRRPDRCPGCTRPAPTARPAAWRAAAPPPPGA